MLTRDNECGFTILEVMIAIVVLVAGLLAACAEDGGAWNGTVGDTTRAPAATVTTDVATTAMTIATTAARPAAAGRLRTPPAR